MNSRLFELPISISITEGGTKKQFSYTGDYMLTIGRSKDCHIRLATARSSRLHAHVMAEGGFLTIIDKSSGNGLVVEGERCEKHDLSPGDAVIIGDARIQFGSLSVVEPRVNYEEVAAGVEQEEEFEQEGEGREEKEEEVRSGARAADAQRPLSQQARTLHSRGASSMAQSINIAVPMVVVGVLACLFAVYQAGLGPFQSLTNVRQQSAAGPTDSKGLMEFTDGSGDGGQQGNPLSPEDVMSLVDFKTLQAEEQWDEKWGILGRLQDLVVTHPGTVGATRAKRWIEVLGAVKAAVEEADTQRAERVLALMLEEGQYSQALAICTYLERATGEVTRWQQRRQDVEDHAKLNFFEIEQELSKLNSIGESEQALRLLLGIRQRYVGSAAFGNALPGYLQAALQGSGKSIKNIAFAERESRLRETIAVRFAECRFDELEALYYQLLALNDSVDNQLYCYEGLSAVHYLKSMFSEFLSKAGGKALNSDLGRVLRVTPDFVEFERSIDGNSYPESRRWSRLSAVSKGQLFMQTVASRNGVAGMVLYSMMSGDRAGAERYLVRLYRRKNGRELAEVLNARVRNVPRPAEGFVIFEDRLLSPVEKEKILADRRAAIQREREVLAALWAKKLSDTLASFINIALDLRKEGRYELAQKALAEIAAEDQGEVSSRAQKILDDPFLSEAVLIENGPNSRRIDVYILGEGYPILDDYQAQFKIEAHQIYNILRKEEPYREYFDYFNYYAANLGSRDKGVDRIPGDIVRDTALGGKVEYDVFTVNRGLVMSVLAKRGERGADRLAIVIGLDNAGVATGGGGVAAMTRGMSGVVGHEVGHAFASLHDEYDEEPGNDPDKKKPERRTNVPTMQLPPNLMAGSHRITVLERAIWQHWIEAGPDKWWNGSKVEVFEGGNRQRYNIWRPQMGCKMRTASARFCVVCMEEMVLKIYDRVRPIDRVEPEQAELVVKNSGKLVVKLWPMMPATHDLEVTWTLLDLGPNKPEVPKKDGGTGVDRREEVGEVVTRRLRMIDANQRIVHAVELRFKNKVPGYYRLRATVKDLTPWVIRDVDGKLTQRRDWQIEHRGK